MIHRGRESWEHGSVPEPRVSAPTVNPYTGKRVESFRTRNLTDERQAAAEAALTPAQRERRKEAQRQAEVRRRQHEAEDAAVAAVRQYEYNEGLSGRSVRLAADTPEGKARARRHADLLDEIKECRKALAAPVPPVPRLRRSCAAPAA